MGKYYLGTGNQQINFQVVDSTGVINDLNLSGLYLSITGKAADADKLDNYDSSFFRNIGNLTGVYTGAISGKATDSELLDGLDSSYFLNGANITGTVSLSGTFTGYYTGAFSGTITHTDYIRFHTGLGINPDPAELTWDDNVGTMQLGLDANVDLRVGFQNYEFVANRNASTLSKGSVVYISGAQGNRPAVALALANADSTSAVTFGILAEDIPSMADGYAITNGLLTNLNTTGFAEGAALYLSPTVSGAIISSKPQAPNHGVLVGFCVRSHQSAGEILVKIQNGPELDELHDVRIISAQNNDIIRYNAPSGVWFNSNTLALNGTGSHYISGDLGIGTSSPNAKLHIFGADKRQIITSTTDNAALVLGQWDGATNRIESSTRKLLITSYASGISLGVNGSENVHVSTSGNLGVGTTSPQFKLDVNGASVFRDTINVGPNIGTISWGSMGGGSGFGIRAESGRGFSLGSNGNWDYIVINTSGNVGIGTTSPTQKFYVSGGNAAIEYVTGSVTYTPSALNTSPRLTLIGQYSTTDTYNFIRYWSGGNHDWSVGTVTQSSGAADYIFQSYNGSAHGERVRITAAGNVGIGITIPLAKLHLYSDDTNVMLSMDGSGAPYMRFLKSGTATGYIGTAGAFSYGGNTDLGIRADNSLYVTSLGGSQYFNAGAVANILVIASTGNVGIGTTSPSYKLHVNGNSFFEDILNIAVDKRIQTYPSSVGGYAMGLTLWSANTSGASEAYGRPGFIGRNLSWNGSNFIAASSNAGSNWGVVTGMMVTNTDVRFLTRAASENGLDYSLGTDLTSITRMVINTSGNVGIGTTSPNEKLEVGGNISVRTYSGTYGSLRFGTTNASYLDAWAGIESDWESTGVNVANLKFYTSYGSRSEKMRITSAGNIGIGTTSPVANLHIYRGVNSTVATLGEVASYSTVKIGKFRADQDNSLYIGNAGSFCSFLQGANDAGSNAMHILINPFGGNVGIGTTSPADLLNIQGTNKNIRVTNTAAYNASGTAYLGFNGYYNSSNADSWFARIVSGKENTTDNDARGYLSIQTNNPSSGIADRVRIDSNGNLGIGTTTPYDKLEVAGGIAATGYTTGNASQAHATLIGVNGGTSYLQAVDWGAEYKPLNIEGKTISLQTGTGSTSSRFYIDNSGNVGVGTTSPNQKLEIKGGNVRIDNRAAGSYSAPDLEFLSGDSSGSWNVFKIRYTKNATLDRLEFIDGGNSNAFVIANGGNVTALGNLAVNGTGTSTINNLSIAPTSGHVYLTGPNTAGKFITLQNGNATGGINFRDSAGNEVASYYQVTDAWTFSKNTTISGNLTVSQNLIVNGTTTTINSTVTTIDDPIITLGGDTAPTVDDNKDRGIEFRWHNGTAAKVGFFGFDDSTGYFTFIPDATNSSEVFSGTQGDIQASNFRGTLIGNSSTTTKLNVTDSRNTADTPETISMGVVADFKANATNSLSDGGTYNGVLTFRQYGSGTDWSGGRSHQLAFTDNDNIWHRSGTSTSWGTWYKIWHQNNDGAGSGLDADLLDGYNQDTANTANTVVRRDASGNFSAGVITGTRLEARNSGTTQIYIDSTNNGSKEIVFQNNGATTGYVWQSGTYVGLGGGSASTSIFVTTSNGNVGVGTTTPSNKLDVNGSVRTNDWYYVESSGFGMYNNANAMWWASHASGSYSLSSNTTFSGIKLYSGGSVNTWRGHFYGDSSGQGFLNSSGNWQFIVNSSGNVGIGTTSPAAKLEVNGDFKNGLVYRYPHSQIAPALNSTGWIKLATIPNNSRAKFLMRNGSANSEETLEFDVYSTYFNSGVYVVISRNTYNHHLTEIQVQGADGQPRIVYVKCRTSDYAPTFIWQVESWNGASTIHNTEETPTSGKNFVIGTTGYLNANYVPNVYFDGNVGIGQIPATKLNVKEQNSGTEGFIVTNWNGVNTVLAGSDSSSGGGKFTLKTNAGANAVFISSTASSYFNGGKVGINTTSPDSFLQIKTTTAQTTIDDANQILTIENAAATDASGNLGGIRFRQINATNAANGFIGLSSTGSSSTRANLVFASPNTSGNATEKMRLTAYGTLLVGDNIDFTGSAWWNNGNAVLGKNGTDKVVIGYLASNTLGAMIGAHNSAMTAWAAMNINGTSISFRILEATKAVLDANGAFVQGGGTGRSTYGTTVVLNRAATFAANSDIGDGERFLSIVNDNSTTNAMATLGFRINPNGGNANAMLDMKFVNTGATSTSKLHYSFNHGGSWADRLTIQSDGNVGIGTTTPTNKLHVQGNAYINSTLFVNGETTLEDKLIVKTQSGSHNVAVIDYSGVAGGRIQVLVDGVVRSQIGSYSADNTFFNAGYGGNVGIGISTPSDKLDILGTTASNAGRIMFGDGGNYTPYMRFYKWTGTSTNYYQTTIANSITAAGALEFYTGGGGAAIGSDTQSLRMIILQGGNVGIGTTSPSVKLHVVGSSILANNTSIDPDAYANTTIAGNIADGGGWGVGAGIGGNSGTGKSWAIGVSGDLYFGYQNGSANDTMQTFMQVGTNRNLFFVPVSGNVGIGTTTPGYKLEVNGSFAATTKSFVIPHPTKEGKKLRYGSLEGPENGVYVRGKTISKVIELPDYWTKLVDPDSITVQLTPIGSHQKLYVEKIEDNKVYIANENLLAKSINCFFYILAERADVEKLQVEIDA
jgi:hypothetical protein